MRVGIQILILFHVEMLLVFLFHYVIKIHIFIAFFL
jgi:hypothetical protein